MTLTMIAETKPETEAPDRFVWSSTKSHVAFNHGAPMTLDEAREFVATWCQNSHDFTVVNDRKFTYQSGFGQTFVYEATRPVLADPHAVINKLDLIDLRFTVEQGQHLKAGLRAAADGDGKAAMAALLQLLATPVAPVAADNKKWPTPPPRPARRIH